MKRSLVGYSHNLDGDNRGSGRSGEDTELLFPFISISDTVKEKFEKDLSHSGYNYHKMSSSYTEIDADLRTIC